MSRLSSLFEFLVSSGCLPSSASWVEKVDGAENCKFPTEFQHIAADFRHATQNFNFFLFA